MTEGQVRDIISSITYRDWRFLLHVYDTQFHLQVAFIDPESGNAQFGRRWTLPWHATPSELIHTALLAVLTAEEHEARERFRFAGRPIFHPHHLPEDLLAIADRTDARAYASPENIRTGAQLS